MKKFFSLVLALVMALSLTTVAWGADENPCASDPCAHEAAIGEAHYDKLETAVAAATAGQTVVMLTDATVESSLVVNKAITLDGNGMTLFADAALGGLENAGYNDTHATVRVEVGCTIKNLTIEGGFKGILIQPQTTGEVLLDTVTVVKSCRGINFNSGSSLVSDADLTVKNSTLAGWCSFGNAGDVVFENCEFVVNASTRGNGLNPRNDMALTNCVIEDGFEMNFEDLDASDSVSFEDCVYDGEPLTEDNFADFADDTYYNAAVHAVAVAASAGVKTNFYEADSTATTKWALVDTFPGATVADFLVEADYEDGVGGNIEYYDVNGVAYVEATKATGAYKLVCGKTEVFLNLAADVDYEFEAEAFTGVTTDEEACGKVLVTKKNLTKTYYTATIEDNKVEYTFYFVADKAGAVDLLVGGKIVKAEYVGDDFSDDVDNNFIAHSWVGNDVDATTKAYTTAICENCGRVAKLYANADAAGKKAEYLTNLGWITAADAGYDVVVPTTPSTDKVTSADTFDAGIAMYVGMSVMAAAGSAVVIGKKKD